MDALQKLGIDGWSILLYLVNMGLLLALLTKFLYRPLLKVMDDRRETVRKNLQETELLKTKFAEESKRQAQETKDLLVKMQSEVAAAKAQAEVRAKELIAEADTRREQMLEEARRQVDETKKGVLKEVEKETQKRIEQTILHVLKNKIPADIVKSSVEAAWKDLQA
ncbi:ATP synthase F0 subunit B [Patescibacteria group bacterium]|nr:ATP synthase F0 subunit B [Patescibacteria group bacterium]MBP9709502.1 ATP synthase F0 subunit B [Patescibacteria group bacterium]